MSKINIYLTHIINYDFFDKSLTQTFSDTGLFGEWLRENGFIWEFEFKNKETTIKPGSGVLIQINETGFSLGEAIAFLETGTSPGGKFVYLFSLSNQKKIVPEFYDRQIEYERFQINRAFKNIDNESDDFSSSNGIVSANWYLDSIDIENIHDEIDFGTVVLGIVDGGIHLDHEDISSNNLSAISNSEEGKHHGTAVYGTLSGSIANNSIGTLPIYTSKTYFAYLESSDSQRIKAIENVTTKKPKVINLSIGISTDLDGSKENYDFHEFAKGIGSLRNKLIGFEEILFIISSGNSGVNGEGNKYNNALIHYVYDPETKTIKFSPLDNVITVAAHNYENRLFAYSDYGLGVDLAAPSGFMSATYKTDYYKNLTFSLSKDYLYYSYNEPACYTGDYQKHVPSQKEEEKEECGEPSSTHLNQYFDGTSASAPVVSGSAAVLFSLDERLTPKIVKQYLLDSGVFIYERYSDGEPEILRLVNQTQQEMPRLNLYNSYTSLKADIENGLLDDEQEGDAPANDITSGTVNFSNNQTPTNAFLRLVPQAFQSNSGNFTYGDGLRCKIQSNGTWGNQDCVISAGENKSHFTQSTVYQALVFIDSNGDKRFNPNEESICGLGDSANWNDWSVIECGTDDTNDNNHQIGEVVASSSGGYFVGNNIDFTVTVNSVPGIVTIQYGSGLEEYHMASSGDNLTWTSSRSFDSAGEKTVTVRVYDTFSQDNVVDTHTLNITVVEDTTSQPDTDIVNFNYSQPNANGIFVGDSVDFYVSLNNDQAALVTIQYGSGLLEHHMSSNTGNTSWTHTRQFESAGTKTVMVRVYDQVSGGRVLTSAQLSLEVSESN